ncbi:MAG: tRNA pseudouridine(13) synthase TruD [Candidatus Bathyarchaeia archaeon]|nr:tRNA pseudouridine(13) synthase TruD [Candidatus Bathyarchaeota archaeon]
MLNISSIEVGIGIEVYASKTRGLGGIIKRSIEDFIVEEILLDGSKASVLPEENRAVLDEHGRYLICILIKRGWDTLLAIEKIAKALGISLDRIGFAGIKDAEALTAQYISIGGMPIERLSGIRLENIYVKPIGFSNENISSKKLFGNKFRIAVNSIRLKESTVLSRIRRINYELADFGGVPNFFGHQRFGTVRPITHIVGRHIVKGDFKSAVLTFLTFESPFENPRIRMLRREINETMDFGRILKKFPGIFTYERLMLAHLSRSPNDFLGALNKLPLNLRKLLVQAYQSFLFNKILSERIKRGITLKEAHVGDYVLELNGLGLPMKNFIKVELSNISLINEEIKDGKMVIAIPLIGLKQHLSGGLQGEIEREILEREGIKQENFRNAHMIKVDILGGLRAALARIMDFRFEVSEDKIEPLKSSVKFRFTLHKGGYATILLREFMKPSTDRQLIKSGF